MYTCVEDICAWGCECVGKSVYLYINHTVCAFVVYMHVCAKVKALEIKGLCYLCCIYLPKDICCIRENLTAFYMSMCVSLNLYLFVLCLRQGLKLEALKSLGLRNNYNLNLHHVISTHPHQPKHTHTHTFTHLSNNRLSVLLNSMKITFIKI